MANQADIIETITNAPNIKIYTEFGFTLLAVVFFLIAKKIVRKLIKSHAALNKHSESRMTYMIKLANFGLIILLFSMVALIWEISFEGISVYLASLFTIIGVAFFASWSLLSNITAYMIIFFYFPFKIGSKIRIVDGDNSVEGKVEDLTLFFIKIKLLSGETMTYPNNLAIQKPIKEL